MSNPTRGVLYMVWGDKIRLLLERSIRSLKRFHPDLPVHVCCPDEDDWGTGAFDGVTLEKTSIRGLPDKACMWDVSPFDVTLFLDADTIVMGDLVAGFRAVERHGLACCIADCPWQRRYMVGHGRMVGEEPGDGADNIIYSTGVIFFAKSNIQEHGAFCQHCVHADHAKAVFREWKNLVPLVPAANRWQDVGGEIKGLAWDDQPSFSEAVRTCGFNPHVLPANFNFVPNHHKAFFSPLKVWHSYFDPPDWVVRISEETDRNRRLVTYCQASE